MVKITYKDYLLDLTKNIYLPSDDTFLFMDLLEDKIKSKINKVLDLGCGNGFLSFYLYDFSKKIISSDINPEVIEYMKNTKNKYNLNKLEIKKSDLFSNITEKFDLIVFNPPYVPSKRIPTINDEKDLVCSDGGKDGSEIIIRFINSLSDYLNIKGKCFLLISSLNNLNYIKKKIIKNKLKYKIVREKSLFFERLYILEINK